MDIIMLRHGETVDNKKGVYSRDNTYLTKKGREEIKEAKKLLKDYDYKKVYCSPLVRARESLDILDIGASKVYYEDRIREVDFGIFKGYNYREILKLYEEEVKKWSSDYLNYKIPKGDSIRGKYKALDRLLNDLIKEGENVLLVCHGGVIQIILAWVFDNYEYFPKFQVDNGSISTIKISEGFKFIGEVNKK